MHASRRAHPLLDQRLEGLARYSLRYQGQYDVTAFAVGEAFTGGELGRPVGQDRKVSRCPIKLIHRNVEHLIGDVHGLLVKVVTNPGPVREKMLDGHLITDQRKIRT
jgi:hypothetical protein